MKEYIFWKSMFKNELVIMPMPTAKIERKEPMLKTAFGSHDDALEAMQRIKSIL